MGERGQDLRRVLIAALLCLIACAGAVFLDGPDTRGRATARAAGPALDELAFLAGLESERGEQMRAESFPVTVVQEAGPLWLAPAIGRAVTRTSSFVARDSPHLLRIEPIIAGHVVIVQLRLWRQGWDLRTPRPFHLQIAPWVSVLAGVLGVALGLATRRVSAGLALAGVASQLGLAALPWPTALLGPYDWSSELRNGPMVASVERLVVRAPELSTAIAMAVLVFSLILVAFDHRRSEREGESLGIATVAGIAIGGGGGALLWLEAAIRGATFAATFRVAGVLTLVALAGAWGVVVLRARRPDGRAWVEGAGRGPS